MCGCGGSTRQAAQVPREQVVAPRAGVGHPRARTVNGDGTVWNGPQHAPEPVAEPTPEPAQA